MAKRIRTDPGRAAWRSGAVEDDKLPSLQHVETTPPVDAIRNEGRKPDAKRDRIPNRHEPPSTPSALVVQPLCGRPGKSQPKNDIGREVGDGNLERLSDECGR